MTRKDIGQVAAGVAFMVASAAIIGMIRCPEDAYVMVPLAALVALPGGWFLRDFVAAPLVNLLGNVYYPANNRARVPEQFTRVQALMAECRYEEAERELRTTLDQLEDPDLLAGQILLANLLHEHLESSDEALALASEALDVDEWQPDHERLVTLATDILLERGARAEAAEFLGKYAAKATGTPAAARLIERLQHLDRA